MEPGDGLRYAIYGNGRKADGSYNNVVIAFGGSNDSDDWTGNLSIYMGREHPQVKYLQQAAQYVAEYNADNVYSTGNSLGGYLAQYFAAYTMQKNADWASDFHHSSLFNTAILKVVDTLLYTSPASLREARTTTNNFVKTKLPIDYSDVTDPVQISKTNSYVIQLS